MNIQNYLCETLCLSKTELTKFSNTAPHRYKVYKIKKRNSSELRTIAHPSKELKFIQRLIVSALLEKLKPHNSAYAYIKKIGIKNNAQQHINSKYLLKMDFRNFFLSITPELLFSTANKNGINFGKTDEKLLSNLLFWRPDRKGNLKLSIGAPSSPLISNFVMFEFDLKMTKICQDRKITYTRYADDITFSTSEKGALFEIQSIVSQALEETTDNKVTINLEKTVYSSKGHNRHITGITLTNNNTLSIGREKKRLISAMIHRYKHSLLESVSISKLQGLLAHASHIEPDFNERMKRKYGEDTLQNIKAEQPNLPASHSPGARQV